MNVSNMRLSSGIVFGMLTIVLVACGSMPNSVDAQVVSQLDSSAYESPVTSGLGKQQNLGTGLLGTASGFHWVNRYLANGDTGINWYGVLVECNSTCVPWNQVGATIVASSPTFQINADTGTTTRNLVFTSAYILNPAKYYGIAVVYHSGAGGPLNMIQWVHGSATNVYSGGVCGYNQSAGSIGTLTGVPDCYFSLEGATGGTQSQQRFSALSPYYGQVKSSAFNVNFSYNYYINDLSYDKAGFTLVDNTAFQSVAVSSLEDTVNASGNRTYSIYFDLVTGHSYTWQPYLRNSSSGLRITASSTTFFAGAQSNQSIPNSPAPLWNGCTNILCQGATHGTTTGLLTWNGGTTTTPFGPFGQTLDDLLAQKAPFSYLYDIKQVLYELANGNGASPYNAACTSQDAYYTLPTGSMGTVLSNGSTTVKIIDACAVKAMSPVVYIRQTITYALYLVTGLGLASMALGIL